MDSSRFDQLSRLFGQTRSRRDLTRTVGAMLGASALTGVAVESSIAADGQKKKSKCKPACKNGAKCINGACFNSCPRAGTCSGSGVPMCEHLPYCGCIHTAGGGNPICGGSEPNIPKKCKSNKDCAKGYACINAPGCVTGRDKFCVPPCDKSIVMSAGATSTYGR